MFRVTRQCDWRREEHRGSRSNGVGGDAAERVAVPDSCQGFRGPVLQNHDLREESSFLAAQHAPQKDWRSVTDGRANLTVGCSFPSIV